MVTLRRRDVPSQAVEGRPGIGLLKMQGKQHLQSYTGDSGALGTDRQVGSAWTEREGLVGTVPSWVPC